VHEIQPIQYVFSSKPEQIMRPKLGLQQKKYMYLPCDVSGRGVLVTNQCRSHI